MTTLEPKRGEFNETQYRLWQQLCHISIKLSQRQTERHLYYKWQCQTNSRESNSLTDTKIHLMQSPHIPPIKCKGRWLPQIIKTTSDYLQRRHRRLGHGWVPRHSIVINSHKKSVPRSGHKMGGSKSKGKTELQSSLWLMGNLALMNTLNALGLSIIVATY